MAKQCKCGETIADRLEMCWQCEEKSQGNENPMASVNNLMVTLYGNDPANEHIQQKEIDQDAWWGDWLDENEKAEAKMHQKPEPVQAPTPAEETEFVDGNHKVGDEITDEDGNVYVAIQPSYYISDADGADLEDGWDAQVTVGWHTPARLKSQSTEVIVEQVQTGHAKIVRREGKTCVLFHDEWQSVPLDDLAYSSELGLYRKSVFPEVK